MGNHKKEKRKRAQAERRLRDILESRRTNMSAAAIQAVGDYVEHICLHDRAGLEGDTDPAPKVPDDQNGHGEIPDEVYAPGDDSESAAVGSFYESDLNEYHPELSDVSEVPEEYPAATVADTEAGPSASALALDEPMPSTCSERTAVSEAVVEVKEDTAAAEAPEPWPVEECAIEACAPDYVEEPTPEAAVASEPWPPEECAVEACAPDYVEEHTPEAAEAPAREAYLVAGSSETVPCVWEQPAEPCEAMASEKADAIAEDSKPQSALPMDSTGKGNEQSAKEHGAMDPAPEASAGQCIDAYQTAAPPQRTHGCLFLCCIGCVSMVLVQFSKPNLPRFSSDSAACVENGIALTTCKSCNTQAPLITDDTEYLQISARLFDESLPCKVAKDAIGVAVPLFKNETGYLHLSVQQVLLQISKDDTLRSVLSDFVDSDVSTARLLPYLLGGFV